MADYIELEYIESTGTQYIDTNYVPNNNTKFEIKASTKGVREHTGMFGARIYYTNNSQTNWNTYAFLSYWEMSDWTVPNAIRVDILGTGNSIEGATGKTWVIDTPYIIDIDMIARTLKIDNQIMKSSFGPIDNKVITTMSLFANHSEWKYLDGSDYQSPQYQWPIIGRVYYCKIYDNNELVKDFIPVKRKSDNTVCLYDKVSKTYFTNQGTGSFIAGPEISEPTIQDNIALITTKIVNLTNLTNNILGINKDPNEIIPDYDTWFMVGVDKLKLHDKETYLRVLSYDTETPTKYNCSSLLYWDLSKYIFTDISKINTATFWVYYYDNDIPERAQVHPVRQCLTSWTTDSILGNSDMNSTKEGSLSGGYGWRTCNITNLFKKWLNNTVNNCGIIIDNVRGQDNSGGYWARMLYYSTEADNDYKPKLVITYNE